MVYVHGANSSVYRASAQAAQYRHFTGRNSVVIAFLWPSAESLFKYNLDVRHAAKTVPVFIRFLELLSRNTKARNINILAYSAGAQIVSPALKILGEEHALPNKKDFQNIRIGEVYFAAPDVDFTLFVDQVPDHLNIVHNVTVSANTRDRVLSFSERKHGKSRAGRPNPDELSYENFKWFKETSALKKNTADSG